MNDIASKIAQLKHQLLNAANYGESEQLCGRLSRALDLMKELPRRVAAQGPFANSDEARLVLDREVAVVIQALDGVQ